MKKKNKEPILLRREMSSNIIASTDDQITNHLLKAACYSVTKRFLENHDLPEADFDIGFFTEVMLEFCGNHRLLQDILDGNEVGWLAD